MTTVLIALLVALGPATLVAMIFVERRRRRLRRELIADLRDVIRRRESEETEARP